MKISIIAFTDNGMEIANRLADNFNHDVSSDNYGDIDLTRCEKGGLSQWTEEHFSTSDALIFIGAIGIAVRAIAPFIKTKTKDPAVVVVDELGQFSIPVLSGHIGGANDLALQVSNILDAVPVVTTATDINNLFAVDTWAKSQGLRISNPKNIKLVSSKLLEGKTIHIKSEYPIKGNLPKNLHLNDLDNDNEYDVIVSHKNYEDIALNKDILLLIPPIITVGIGCRKDIDFKILEKRILNALDNEDCHILSLNSIASIDKKANEKGTAATDALSDSIKKINLDIQACFDKANEAKSFTTNAGNQVAEANTQMEQMLLAMNEINNRSQEISKIIKTIEDIAFQTNILALNAAVEAARAGTAGKGFAVVADEVRNLAAKSAEASQNTSALIEASISAVAKGVKLAQDTASQMKVVAESASQTMTCVVEVSELSERQARAMEQINQNVNQIGSVVAANSATAEESAAASEELSSQAAMLKELVGGFQLNDQYDLY